VVKKETQPRTLRDVSDILGNEKRLTSGAFQRHTMKENPKDPLRGSWGEPPRFPGKGGTSLDVKGSDSGGEAVLAHLGGG